MFDDRGCDIVEGQGGGGTGGCYTCVHVAGVCRRGLWIR